ncbi:hypothetical protein [Sulfobacillus sp. hq2]|uniref:type III-A CRISPR-associated protein Cas10/Csm1 n=1 Tax=Sulfobacillus sp. hq2 TaxID=2039167 RepID=UPI000CD2D95C|nr:hypothetical protein [Sulfobacillus sp. hq2]POB10103.1 hypothetical protein CO251_11495 [Sulfobacillus sp. hq2]
MREVLHWVLQQCATWADQPVHVRVDGQTLEVRPEPGRTFRVEPLPSIFNDVSLSQGLADSPLYVVPDAGRVPYPCPINRSAFWREWGRSVSRVIGQCAAVVGSVPQVLERVLAIVGREWSGFGLTVVSSGSVVALPVYLRMQVAWALAAQAGRARLVYGDFSGIQAYVFASSRLGVSGVAKTLRARSARIGLLSLGVPWATSVQITQTGLLVLSSVGGGFSLLLPPTASLAAFQSEINAWLHDVTHAQVVLYSTEMEVTAEEFFENYGVAMRDLHAQVGASKRQPLNSYLFSTTDARHDPWVWRTPGILQSRCARCEKYPVYNAEGLCYGCAVDQQIGSFLPRIQWIQLRNDSHGSVAIGPHWSLALSSERPQEQTHQMVTLNDVAQPPMPTLWMNVALPIASEDCPHCQRASVDDPVRAGQPYTFACLAALEAGATPRLGYLKVDVDNLGLLMTVGLSQNTTVGTDVYRVIRLQETVDRFFTEGVRQLMQDGRMLYTVFSGGDDLYLIGGAQHIAQFALTLAERFTEYTGYHSDVTLSAGMIFVDPHLSIALATEAVERALYQAKHTPSADRRAAGILTGRNQVTIGTTTLSWRRYRLLWEESQEVARLLRHEWLSASALHRLLQAAQYALQRPIEEQAASWFPRATYEMRRHFTADEQQPVRTWLAPYLQADNPDLFARLTLFPLLVSLVRLRSDSDPAHIVQEGK